MMAAGRLMSGCGVDCRTRRWPEGAAMAAHPPGQWPGGSIAAAEDCPIEEINARRLEADVGRLARAVWSRTAKKTPLSTQMY